MFRKKKLNYPRRIVQWTIMGLLLYMVVRFFSDKNYVPDFESFCPYGGMQAFSSYLVNNSLACSMTSVQIFMGIGLIIGIVIFSKLFCGYICPIGTITEWLGNIGRKFKIQYTPVGIIDKSLRIFKYILLFITFYFSIESSELFCKKFDPYYAAFTGFSSDVDLVYAVIALVITIIGSIFIRQAWCKYFCPLGAISNLFTYFPVFVVIFGIYWIVLLTGVSASWMIPMIAVIAIAFFIEFIRLKDGIIIPFFRITRNNDTCTNCKLCDKTCPQGINVSSGPIKINNIDCNMCGDCITACPQKDTLQINKKNLKWLPVILIVILVSGGIFFGKTTELPTVSEQWGTTVQMGKAKVLNKSGLKDIKCFGSSTGFVAQMHEIKGVLGAATYVGSHSVKVWYDPMIISETALLETLFSSIKYEFQTPDSSITQLSVLTVHIKRFFDKYDAANLKKLLELQKGVIGLETKYGEPVIALVYYDSKYTDAEKIKKAISSKEFSYDGGENKVIVNVDFEVVADAGKQELIDRKTFLKKMFVPYFDDFNSYRKYTKDQLQIFEIPIVQIEDPMEAEWIPYLESHISRDNGVVAIETKYDKDIPVGRIYFVTTLTDSAKIYNSLLVDSFKVKYESGAYGFVKNPYKFIPNGSVVKP